MTSPELQRFADSVARRMLADELNRDSAGATSRPDENTGDDKADGLSLLGERQVVPPRSDVDRQRRVKVA